MKHLLLRRRTLVVLVWIAWLMRLAIADEPAMQVEAATQKRPVTNETELLFWLENMAIWHRYSTTEISQVLGITEQEVQSLLRKHGFDGDKRRPEFPQNRLAIQPYPGGRHPRVGFLDGAIEPQRETKFSIFTPWDAKSYIVADIPEALFSNLGLIYLAHTHIPTIWDKQGIKLPVQEWSRGGAGALSSQRSLPNGIRIEVTVTPKPDHVRMELSLFNGTAGPLTGLRVQHCLMLARATGFNTETNDNKKFRGDYAAVHDAAENRWLITSWKPLGRGWGNPPVPCLHADPVLPDCPAGETTRAQGWISFYEGTDWRGEIERIEATKWW